MKKHGMYKTRIYAIWSGMKNRCFCKGFSNYSKYGAKGVTVCDKWLDFCGFYEDMGSTYFDGATLDRIDNSKGYSKDNCRWATYLEQSRNRSNSRLFKWQGEEHTASSLAKIAGISRHTMYDRLVRFGWSVEQAMTTVPNPANTKI